VKDALGSVQSVLVLGGGSDIAMAVLRRLVAARTRTVVLAGRDPEALEPRAKELRGAGATDVDLVRFDADDLDSHPGFAAEVFGRHGDIDLVLVAFGVLGDDSVNEQRDAAVALLRTNFLGTASVLLPVVERLREQGHGTVVVLSSVAGERVRKSNFVYGSSKAAVDGFAQGLGDSLQGSGVHVMVVRPGFVHTKMTAGLDPAPFSTTPEAVADAILKGLRRGADTVWAPPLLRWVMAAVRHLPRPLFRRLDL
jgi:decaprenylphospho-beta-D-erythro-pentofuranosid-2-ulose 2-reductase